MGNDMRNVSDASKAILFNKDAIAVNQASATGRAASWIREPWARQVQVGQMGACKSSGCACASGRRLS